MLNISTIPIKTDSQELNRFLTELQDRIIMASQDAFHFNVLTTYPLRPRVGDVRYLDISGLLEGLYVFKTTGWEFMA